MEKDMREQIQNWALEQDAGQQFDEIIAALDSGAIDYLRRDDEEGDSREAIARNIKSRLAHLPAALEFYDEEPYQMIAAAQKGPVALDSPEQWHVAEMLFKLGILFPCKTGAGFACVLPEEYKEACKDTFAPRQERRRRKRQDLFQIVQAAVNLYGFIPQDELLEICNKMDGTSYSEDDLFELLIPYVHLNMANFMFYQDYVASTFFDDSVDEGAPPDEMDETDEEMAELKKVIKEARGKPRYVPKRAEFLRYQNTVYFEKTAVLSGLAEMIDEVNGKGGGWETIAMLYDFCRTTPDCIEQLSALDWSSVEPTAANEKESREGFEALLRAVFDHTRRWADKGHTPHEIANLGWRPRAAKAGRNDPCPCGSGKKYKKCCLDKDRAALLDAFR